MLVQMGAKVHLIRSFLSISLARLCPFWRGFEFISSAGPEDSLLFDDAEGVVERKNGAPEGTR